ncbi:MAG: ribonuclease HII [Desulfobacteraceae bacterium]|nr:MAG: ribonuclease HII [Desulfobacteraceae bacterium]
MVLFQELGAFAAADTLHYEKAARQCGYGLIAGVDEAGRGPLAGPVVAAAVILPAGISLPGVTDSKKMTAQARERAFDLIQAQALTVGVGVVSRQFIDEKNILKAALEAMKRAVLVLDPAPEFLLVDGMQAPSLSMPQQCLKKGDQKSLSISAASVIAKVYRDRIMCAHHEIYPQYGFAENKGYGTARHLAAIRTHGPCPIHRLTFKGVL